MKLRVSVVRHRRRAQKPRPSSAKVWVREGDRFCGFADPFTFNRNCRAILEDFRSGSKCLHFSELEAGHTDRDRGGIALSPRQNIAQKRFHGITEADCTADFFLAEVGSNYQQWESASVFYLTASFR